MKEKINYSKLISVLFIVLIGVGFITEAKAENVQHYFNGLSSGDVVFTFNNASALSQKSKFNHTWYSWNNETKELIFSCEDGYGWITDAVLLMTQSKNKNKIIIADNVNYNDKPGEPSISIYSKGWKNPLQSQVATFPSIYLVGPPNDREINGVFTCFNLNTRGSWKASLLSDTHKPH